MSKSRIQLFIKKLKLKLPPGRKFSKHNSNYEIIKTHETFYGSPNSETGKEDLARDQIFVKRNTQNGMYEIAYCTRKYLQEIFYMKKYYTDDSGKPIKIELSNSKNLLNLYLTKNGTYKSKFLKKGLTEDQIDEKAKAYGLLNFLRNKYEKEDIFKYPEIMNFLNLQFKRTKQTNELGI